VAPVVGAGAPPSQITLATDAGGPTPGMDSQPAGTSETLTATVATGGAAQPGITVTFTVVSGPDAGMTGTAVTDAAGHARFTYTGKSAGTDDILASFADSSHTVHTSNDAMVTWTGGDQPITAAGTAVRATEGQPYSGQVATFTDPDPTATAAEYAATIDWGDGTPLTAGTVAGSGGTFAVSGTHTYADEGSHTVTAAITDVDNLANTTKTTSTATVADAGLSAAIAKPASPQAFSGAVATFTDANNTTSSTADFTTTIDWGDGSAPAAGTVRLTGSTYTVNGSHAYTTTGYFTVKVHCPASRRTATGTTERRQFPCLCPPGAQPFRINPARPRMAAARRARLLGWARIRGCCGRRA
jgi:hypothetical protein